MSRIVTNTTHKALQKITLNKPIGQSMFILIMQFSGSPKTLPDGNHLVLSFQGNAQNSINHIC